SYYNKSRQTSILRFVVKIYTDRTTRKIGYIVCDVDDKSFMNIVQKYVYSQGQLIWLQPLGDRPFLLTGDLTGKKSEYYHTITQLVQNNNKPGINSLVSDDSVFFEIPQIKYNLTAFSLTPQFLLEESNRVLSRNLVIIAVLIIIIFSFASIVLSKSLTTPLENMVSTMNRIKEGDTSLRLENLKQDEIGKLGETFNEMLDQIENLIAKEYQSKLLLNQAEYKALQAQVNPHFLYNTLDTMSSIAASQQCSSVSSLCKALSNIFRYSMNMQEPLTTIEKEIIHIKNYMYVMNVRMMNSIDIDIKIDPNLWNECIPRISLQPLVENSILHGLKNKHGEKRIEIVAAPCGEDMIISVIDNGVGMDADKINKQLESSNYNALEKGFSIGLDNINARVKLLFGDKYGVHIESAKGEGSKVTLRIPRVGSKNENG
ncbi:MAG TPA: sensor histidine kinase, partial [Clostridia bacterium]